MSDRATLSVLGRPGDSDADGVQRELTRSLDRLSRTGDAYTDAVDEMADLAAYSAFRVHRTLSRVVLMQQEAQQAGHSSPAVREQVKNLAFEYVCRVRDINRQTSARLLVLADEVSHTQPARVGRLWELPS